MLFSHRRTVATCLERANDSSVGKLDSGGCCGAPCLRRPAFGEEIRVSFTMQLNPHLYQSKSPQPSHASPSPHSFIQVTVNYTEINNLNKLKFRICP